MSKISKLDKVIKGAKNGTLEDLLRQNLIKFCCPGNFGIEEACGGDNELDCNEPDCKDCWNEPFKEARIDEIRDEISSLKWAIETIREEGYSKDMEAVWRILDKLTDLHLRGLRSMVGK